MTQSVPGDAAGGATSAAAGGTMSETTDSAPVTVSARVADGAPGAVPGGYAPPRKRSITIAGHATSISLEPLFWQRLEAEAAAHALPLSALVATIDAARIAADDPPNLASAIRTWLLWRAVSGD
jgi:predicted DNA-binding ribbon-helix-helix protein